jgi:hypothetical protein
MTYREVSFAVGLVTWVYRHGDEAVRQYVIRQYMEFWIRYAYCFKKLKLRHICVWIKLAGGFVQYYNIQHLYTCIMFDAGYTSNLH